MSGVILAIDPGNEQSAYAVIDSESCEPLQFAKLANGDLLAALPVLLAASDVLAIEMVASYGMAVGADVFDTCVWIGRYQQAAAERERSASLIKRNPVKVHHCHSSKAKDSNVIQALVDRFATGQPNKGKGTKAEPGWFYGFAKDVWQAYALAVFVADAQKGLAA